MVKKRRGGRTWDKVRQVLLDAGMNRNNYLVEWSNSRIDYSLLKMIMEEHSPSNSMLLIPYWAAILPGFLNMSLSYFHSFICLGSKLQEYAHQAGFDSFMLIDGMRAMIDLAHRDDTQVEDQVNKIQINKQILQSQEQRKRSMPTTTITMMIKPGAILTLSISRLRIVRRWRE